MKLIDAKDFLDLFYVASAGQDKRFIKAVEMVVEDVPTVDAEPVRHGRWGKSAIVGYDGVNVIWARPCSACGYEDRYYVAHYCPHCGAKMQGGNDEA